MERNNLYPVFLKLNNLKVLIVGGGFVAVSPPTPKAASRTRIFLPQRRKPSRSSFALRASLAFPMRIKP